MRSKNNPAVQPIGNSIEIVHEINAPDGGLGRRLDTCEQLVQL